MSEKFEPVVIGFTCNWCSYRAADMAGTAIYLASKASAYVSGTVIPVDGGIIAASRTF